MKHILLSIFLILSFFSLTTSAKQPHSFDRNLAINAGNTKNVFIDVGAGTLFVKGEDVHEITIHAKVHSKEYNTIDDLQEAFENKMIFSLDETKSTIVFKAITKKKLFMMNNSNIAVDVDIIVPINMNVEIDDSSGSMKIVDINGNLEVDDGSGSTLINNIGGNLAIDDGSGNLTIDTIDGDVAIDDGSGTQTLSNITGSVIIDDGSGKINITNVSGNVTIDDGSGSINVEQLAGNFKLIDGGSGHVYVNGKKWIEK